MKISGDEEGRPKFWLERNFDLASTKIENFEFGFGLTETNTPILISVLVSSSPRLVSHDRKLSLAMFENNLRQLSTISVFI